VRISTRDDIECPYCGSQDLQLLGTAFPLFRCLECDAHFEEEENRQSAPPSIKSHNRRKLRHNKFSEDD